MRARRILAVGIGPLLALGALLTAVTPVAAAGVVGTGTAASCDEAAFNAAFAGGGTITFNCGPAPVGITFTTTKVLTADTTIDGGGLIAFNGNDTVRLFSTDGFDLTLIGLILTDAHADDFGGAVLAGNATVAFVDTTVVDATASFGAVVALFSTDGGSHTVAASRSTFVGNEAANEGGVFYVRGTTFDGEFCGPTPGESNAIAINNTFTDNSAAFGSSAVLFIDVSGLCTDVGNVLHAYNTYAGNTADALFTLFANGQDLEAELAANVLGPNEADCVSGTGDFTSLGYNVTDDATCFAAPTTGDVVVADTMLGPLADNGGFTETMALLPGSPALDLIPPDEVDCGDIPIDQRSVARPQGTNCDAGAYEQELLTDTALPAQPPNAGLPALVLGLAWLATLGGLRLATRTRGGTRR